MQPASPASAWALQAAFPLFRLHVTMQGPRQISLEVLEHLFNTFSDICRGIRLVNLHGRKGFSQRYFTRWKVGTHPFPNN